MTTKENLAAAFAGESQANRKYLAFAKKADEDGLPQLAKLFRATAEAETIHAHAHLRAMGGIKTSVENLKTAIEGEAHEFKEMYPNFLELARKEGDKKAEFSFAYALAVEEIHHGLYEKALAAVTDGKDLADAAVYVCPVCGNPVENEVPATCPVCSVPGKKFIEIS
ncbi:MAG: rubrerythrin family protein [Desulfotignum sp.]|nr:rubrerythrin family protein [Desulfotignum sp.]MCF8125890.1 rubrerythrin family protein [Desulfotignum sp.]